MNDHDRASADTCNTLVAKEAEVAEVPTSERAQAIANMDPFTDINPRGALVYGTMSTAHVASNLGSARTMENTPNGTGGACVAIWEVLVLLKPQVVRVVLIMSSIMEVLVLLALLVPQLITMLILLV